MEAICQADRVSGDMALLRDAGSLIRLVGDEELPIELARFLHSRFAADQIHLFKIGGYERDLIQSASYDGSDNARRVTHAFFARKLQRFEQELVTNESAICSDLAIATDHTQLFESPEFRSFGREMGIGTRITVRTADAQGSVALVMLWSISHGDLSHLKDNIHSTAELLAPLVTKHLAICNDRNLLRDRLSSIKKIENDLQIALGCNRRREAQVGARIIGGRSASEIASELLIGKETVISHRKRLYEHLSIETGRDLLLWYLSNHTYSFH